MEDRIDEQILTNHNRPGRKLKKLKGIVIHWTANTSRGADAQANRNYFNRSSHTTYNSDGRIQKSYASAHYIIDDHSIIRCIPDDEVAYHVGALTYKPIGEEIREHRVADSPNNYLIGIEMCVNEGGDWDKTYRTTVELTRHLLDKHGLTVKNVYRHYDITGKLCPKMMVEEVPWMQFRNDVMSLSPDEVVKEKPVKEGYVLVDGLNVRAGNSVRFPVVAVLRKGDEVTIFDTLQRWLRIGDDAWVHGNYVRITETALAEVEAQKLNVRKGPRVSFDIVTKLDKGDKVKIFEMQGRWARIGDDQWVHADYLLVYDGRKGRVNYRYLNVRDMPSVNGELVGRLKKDDTVDIFKREEEWIYIGDGKWVHSDYISELEA